MKNKFAVLSLLLVVMSAMVLVGCSQDEEVAGRMDRVQDRRDAIEETVMNNQGGGQEEDEDSMVQGELNAEQLDLDMSDNTNSGSAVDVDESEKVSGINGEGLDTIENTTLYCSITCTSGDYSGNTYQLAGECTEKKVNDACGTSVSSGESKNSQNEMQMQN